LILSGGLEPAQLSINSKDAEILATRLFTVEEISRILGVPPHMIGHTDKQTSFGTGIEQQGIGFVRYTLQRHLTPLKQELNRKFWPMRERLFMEHVVEALERADLKTRYEAYRIAMGRAGEMPWMDANEVRRRENLPQNPSLLRNPGKDDGKGTDEKPTE
jgi:HK97 family phage portal protein